MSTKRIQKIYYDVNQRTVYGSNGAELTKDSAPYLTYKEKSQLQVQYVNAAPATPVVDANLSKYTGFAGLSISNSAAVDNAWNSYDTGALNAGLTGAIVSIAVKSLEAAPRAQSGSLVIINGAGASEEIQYTAWTVASSIYTFTVSATLTNTYSANDVVRSVQSRIIKTLDADIDQTDKDTGLFLIDLDGFTTVFEALSEGAKDIDNCIFEHQVKNGSGDIVFAMQIDFRCLNLLDNDGNVPPGDSSKNYIEKIEGTQITLTDDAATSMSVFNLSEARAAKCFYSIVGASGIRFYEHKIAFFGSTAYDDGGNYMEAGSSFSGSISIASSVSGGAVKLTLTLAGVGENLKLVFRSIQVKLES